MANEFEQKQRSSLGSANDNSLSAIRQGYDLMVAFHAIKDSDLRQSIVKLVQDLCNEQEKSDEAR